jgi:hypothetical protein
VSLIERYVEGVPHGVKFVALVGYGLCVTHTTSLLVQPKQTTPNVAMMNKGSYTHFKIQTIKQM